MADNARRAVELGTDFLWLAGNPGTGASTQLIAQGVAEVAEAVGDQVLIIAGKMHGAELGRADVVSEEAICRYAEAGADIIAVPAPGTVTPRDNRPCAEGAGAGGACQAEWSHTPGLHKARQRSPEML